MRFKIVHQRRGGPLVVLALILSLIAFSPTQGSVPASGKSHRLWVGLILGENEGGDRAGPGAVARPLFEQLKEVFGFTGYRLVHGGEVELVEDWTQWIVPRRDFFVGVTPRSRSGAGAPEIDYQIYQEKALLAKGHYRAAEGIPLFINGPDLNRGRLIFVLERR